MSEIMTEEYDMLEETTSFPSVFVYVMAANSFFASCFKPNASIILGLLCPATTSIDNIFFSDGFLLSRIESVKPV